MEREAARGETEHVLVPVGRKYVEFTEEENYTHRIRQIYLPPTIPVPTHSNHP